MTKQETVTRLKTDVPFAINFLLENNYPAVKEKLASMGYPVNNEYEAYQVINKFYTNADTARLKSAFSIGYNNAANNYTGGYINLNAGSRTDATGQDDGTGDSFSWGELGNTIGNLIGGIFGIGKQNTGNNDVATLLLLQQQQQKITTKNILIVSAAAIIITAAIIGIVIYTNRKKNKKEN